MRRDEELVLQASSGGFRHDERIPLRGSLAGEAVLSGTPVAACDMQRDARFHRLDLAQSQGWGRALVVPLVPGEAGLPIGAISVYSSVDEPGRFAESDWDKKVLTFLADYAVLAVQNEANQQALRLAQEQRSVAETFAAVGDIASNLLHQLNNKVGTIPVRVQSIQEKSRPALEADPYLANNLAEIERCAAEAMQTVRDNLSHLRPIRLEPVFVAARVVDAIHAANLPPGVRIQARGLDALPVVAASGQSLTFVFVNLFENAADAMHGEGLVTVSGAQGPGWVEVSVSDSGPGIPPDLHERIFELNYSGRNGTRPGKLGFGLWWAKTLVTRLGGAIGVESDGRHGATFRLRLPQADAGQFAAPPRGEKK
jgi:signal transduction histidine kinase